MGWIPYPLDKRQRCRDDALHDLDCRSIKDWIEMDSVPLGSGKCSYSRASTWGSAITFVFTWDGNCEMLRYQIIFFINKSSRNLKRMNKDTSSLQNTTEIVKVKRREQGMSCMLITVEFSRKKNRSRWVQQERKGFYTNAWMEWNNGEERSMTGYCSQVNQHKGLGRSISSCSLSIQPREVHANTLNLSNLL